MYMRGSERHVRPRARGVARTDVEMFAPVYAGASVATPSGCGGGAGAGVWWQRVSSSSRPTRSVVETPSVRLTTFMRPALRASA